MMPSLSLSPISSYAAGFANVSGSTPCFLRFVSAILAKLFAMTARHPTRRGQHGYASLAFGIRHTLRADEESAMGGRYGMTQTAKLIRQHLVGERGLDKAWVKAAGYWKRGAAAIHETHND